MDGITRQIWINRLLWQLIELIQLIQLTLQLILQIQLIQNIQLSFQMIIVLLLLMQLIQLFLLIVQSIQLALLMQPIFYFTQHTQLIRLIYLTLHAAGGTVIFKVTKFLLTEFIEVWNFYFDQTIERNENYDGQLNL